MHALKEELQGPFEDIIIALMTPTAEYDAQLIKKSLEVSWHIMNVIRCTAVCKVWNFVKIKIAKLIYFQTCFPWDLACELPAEMTIFPNNIPLMVTSIGEYTFSSEMVHVVNQTYVLCNDMKLVQTCPANLMMKPHCIETGTVSVIITDFRCIEHNENFKNVSNNNKKYIRASLKFKILLWQTLLVCVFLGFWNRRGPVDGNSLHSNRLRTVQNYTGIW